MPKASKTSKTKDDAASVQGKKKRKLYFTVFKYFKYIK